MQVRTDGRHGLPAHRRRGLEPPARTLPWNPFDDGLRHGRRRAAAADRRGPPLQQRRGGGAAGHDVVRLYWRNGDAPRCRCARRRGAGVRRHQRSPAATSWCAPRRSTAGDEIVAACRHPDAAVGSGGWQPGTSSSSAAATTRWSPPATWPATGLDVEVVERDTVLGGAVSTVERWPGLRRGPRLERAHHGPAHRHRRGPAARRVRPAATWTWTRGASRRSATRRRAAGADLPRRPRPHLRLDRGGVRRPRRRRLPRVRHRLGGPQRGGLRGLPGRADRRPARPAPVGRRQGHRASAGWSCRGSSCSRPTSCSTSTSTTSGSRPRWPGWARSPARRPTRSRPPTWSAGTRCMHRMPPGRAVGGSGALTEALAERLAPTAARVRLGDGAAAITRVRRPGHRRRHRLRRAPRRPAPSSPAATC